MVNKLFGQVKNKLRERTYKKLLPINPQHDDLYLVEFPKSGVTWLSFILANINLKKSKINKKINFYNINDFVHDIHQTRDIRLEPLPVPGFRIIKSHSEFNPYYYKIVYLIRNPKSVVVSYYHFLRKLKRFHSSLSEFVKNEKFGISAWQKHVESWLYKSRPAQRIMFVRYEDLIDKPVDVVKKLYSSFFGVNVENEIIKESLDLSSFERMKKLEVSQYECDLRYSRTDRFSDFKFVREGAKNKGEELTKKDMLFINNKVGNLLKIFEYV